MRCTSVLSVLILSTSLMARPVRRHARVSDPSYSTALATANRFLHAWQTQDHEAGIMMLSDSARERTSLDQLQAFFSPSEQPRLKSSMEVGSMAANMFSRLCFSASLITL